MCGLWPIAINYPYCHFLMSIKVLHIQNSFKASRIETRSVQPHLKARSFTKETTGDYWYQPFPPGLGFQRFVGLEHRLLVTPPSILQLCLWLKIYLLQKTATGSPGFLLKTYKSTVGTMVPLWMGIALQLLFVTAEESCSVQNASCARALLQKHLSHGSQAICW